MEDARVKTNARYDDWVKLLNRNTKFSNESKVKPKAPSSHLTENRNTVRREKKYSTSEIWLG